MNQNNTFKILKAFGLYYQANAPEVDFHSEPRGELSLQRLCDGHADHWRGLSVSVEWKQKRIVLTDPTLPYQTLYETKLYQALLNLIDRLLALKFEIYIWTGELTPIYTTEALTRMTPYVQQVPIQRMIQYCATQHNIPADQIKQLDYFELRQLIQLASVHQLITTQVPSSAVVNFDYFFQDIDFNTFMTRNVDLPQTLGVSINLFYPNLVTYLTQFLTQYAPRVHLLLLSNWRNEIQSCLKRFRHALSYLERVRLKNIPLSVNELIDFLTQFSHIDRLQVKRCDNLNYSNMTDVNLPHLDHLTQLNVETSTVNYEFINGLFKNAPNMKTLKYCFPPGRIIDLSLNSESLETLKLTLDAAQYDALILKTPNLTELALHGCSSKSQYLFKAPMPHLKKIEFTGDASNEEEATKLNAVLAVLQQAPNVEKLRFFWPFENLNSHLTLPQLSALKTLELWCRHENDSCVESAFLMNLLSASPALKELYLKGTTLKNTAHLAYHKPSHSLETLELRFSTLDSRALTNVLTYTSGLKQLFFKDKSRIIGPLKLIQPLNKLMKLDLGCIQLTPHDLITLLSAAPNLETLIHSPYPLQALSKKRGLSLNLPQMLPRLETMTFSNTHVDNIVPIVQPYRHAPFKKIELYQIQFDPDNLSFSNQLPKTFRVQVIEGPRTTGYIMPKTPIPHEFSVSNITLPLSKLKYIISVKPTLRKLSIINTSILEDDTHASVLNTNLETLRIERSVITSETLRVLLQSFSTLKMFHYRACVPRAIPSRLLDDLFTHRHLKVLQIEGADFEAQPALTTRFPYLYKLALYKPKLSNDQLKQLLTQTPVLKTLILDHHMALDAFDFQTILKFINRLRIKNTNTDATVLIRLLTQAPRLSSIIIINTRFLYTPLSERMSLPLLNHLTHLEILTPISAHLLHELLRNSPNLNILSLRFQSSQNIRLVLAFLQHLPNLKTFYIDPTSEVTSYLKQHYPYLLTATALKGPKPISLFNNENSRQLDTQTALPNTSRPVHRYFKNNVEDPEPADYRLDVFRISAAESQASPEPLPIPPLHISNLREVFQSQYPRSKCYYYGHIELKLDASTWTKLPSLTCEESLLYYEANQALTFAYNDQDNIYYTKLAHPAPETFVTIQFILYTPKLSIDNTLATSPRHLHERLPLDLKEAKLYRDQQQQLRLKLPVDKQRLWEQFNIHQKIGALWQFFQQFKGGELQGVTDNDTDIDKVNAIINQKKGACRHRAYACAYMLEACRIPARIVTNHCHAFLEYHANSHWCPLDLGGYPVDTFIVEPTLPQNTSISSNHKDQTASEHHFQNQEPTKQSSNLFSQPDKPTFHEPTAYCQWLFNTLKAYPPHRHNALLITQDQSHTETLNTLFMQFCHQRQRQHRFIPRLDDIQRRTLQVDQHGHFNIIDAPLIQFIQKARRGDVLVIDWSRYASHLVGYNTIIDAHQRRFESMPIPEGVVVIGLLEQKQIMKMGEDFYSRHVYCDETPPKFDIDPYQGHCIEAAPENMDQISAPMIDLHHKADWASVLLGQYQLHGRKITWHKGALIQALEQNQDRIVIQNGPWHIASFRQFWQKTLVQKQFKANDQTYSLPANFQLIHVETPYHLEQYHNQYEWLTQDEVCADYPLNPQTYALFKTTYYCDPSGCLYQQPGWVAQNPCQPLRIFVTASVQEAQWAELLELCRVHQRALHIQVMPGVTLPESMAPSSADTTSQSIPTLNTQSLEPQNFPMATFIETSDIEFTAHQLKKQQQANQLQTFHITSRTDYSDLVETLRHTHNEGQFRFQWEPGPLLQALQAGHTVLLQGRCHTKLAQKLATLMAPKPYLWANGRPVYFPEKAQLILMTTTSQALAPLTGYRHEFNSQEYWQTLYQDVAAYPHFKAKHIALYNTCQALNLDFCFSALRTMLYDEVSTNPFKPFLTLTQQTQLSRQAKQLFQKFYELPKTAPNDKAEDVMIKRLRKVKRYLDDAPYLFIAGETGVGKSLFVLEHLRHTLPNESHLFVGFEQLQAWLTASHQGQKILFLDEANLEHAEALEYFEGLFDEPPNVLWQGKRYTLTQNHKVIFAGNPEHYTGRQSHSLFKRHGAVIPFKALPPDYLTKNIIRPLLEALDLPFEAADQLHPDFHHGEFIKALEHLFLKQYQRAHKTPRPLTPRNLEMMILRFGALWHGYRHHFKQNDQAQCTWRLIDATTQRGIEACEFNSSLLSPWQRVALLACYEELIATEHSDDAKTLRPFIQRDRDLLTQKIVHDFKASNASFILTPSRHALLRQLEVEFTIRQLQIHKPALNTVGRRGICIEGNSGIGKSTFVIEYLKTHGYQQGTQPNTDSNQIKYYHLTPTDPQLMQTVLVQAFHEGAVVIIDELNTLPLEKVLNPLMSGVDLEGRPPERPGFFVIGTQNSMTYSHRQAVSDASKNRYSVYTMPDYSPNELVHILKAQGIFSQQAKTLVQHYQSARAENNDLINKPTPRTLFDKAHRTQSRKRSLMDTPEGAERFSSKYAKTNLEST